MMRMMVVRRVHISCARGGLHDRGVVVMTEEVAADGDGRGRRIAVPVRLDTDAAAAISDGVACRRQSCPGK